jgi:lambda repressor-like predicted transcriptional regulator
MLVLYRNTFRRRLHLLACLLLLASAAGVFHPAQAQKSMTREQAANQLNIQVNDDRMTLSMARVPQIYLYGPIDPDAPQRFEALVKSGRIKPGSDVYLNSPGGSVSAGIALGRLIRQGAMVTHLGVPRLPHQTTTFNRSAMCDGACAYAYLGGLYRWAVSGSDRIGFPTYHEQQTPADVVAYLKDMDIDLAALTAPAGATPSTGPAQDPTLWPNGEEMIAKGLANNGRQNLIATYKYQQGTPYLELKQQDRNGEHKISFLCKPHGAELTTYDTIGAVRARGIVTREQRSYFELDQQETLPQERGGVTVTDDSVVMQRIYPLNQLQQLASAKAMGAWVRDRNGIRFGFAFEVTGVKKVLNDFYQACTSVTSQHS